jgi:hypothetical protein
MATYPKVLKPWRGFPNMNGLHGIAINVNQVPAAQNVYGQPSRSGVVLTRDVAFHVGTLPRGSVIAPPFGFISTGFTAAVTLKIGSKTVPEGILATATIAPQTGGYKGPLAPGTLAAAPLTEDTPVYILAEAAVPAAGVMSLVIPFYIHRD